MSRPRTPSKILDAKGAFNKDPARRRVDADSSEPFPVVAPSHLTPLQVKCWHEIRRAAVVGVLCSSDILAVEIAAILLAELRSGEMQSARIGQLRASFGDLGLSPASRARLSVAPSKPGTGFEDV